MIDSVYDITFNVNLSGCLVQGAGYVCISLVRSFLFVCLEFLIRFSLSYGILEADISCITFGRDSDEVERETRHLRGRLRGFRHSVP